jgi:hypothetical protein
LSAKVADEESSSKPQVKLKGFRRAATFNDDNEPKAATTSRKLAPFETSDLKFQKRYDIESPMVLNTGEGLRRSIGLGGSGHSKINSRKSIQIISTMMSRKSIQMANNNLPTEESKNLLPRTKTETALRFLSAHTKDQNLFSQSSTKAGVTGESPFNKRKSPFVGFQLDIDKIEHDYDIDRAESPILIDDDQAFEKVKAHNSKLKNFETWEPKHYGVKAGPRSRFEKDVGNYNEVENYKHKTHRAAKKAKDHPISIQRTGREQKSTYS